MTNYSVPGHRNRPNVISQSHFYANCPALGQGNRPNVLCAESKEPSLTLHMTAGTDLSPQRPHNPPDT